MFNSLDPTSKKLIFASVGVSLFFAVMGGILINDKLLHDNQPYLYTIVGGKLPFILGVLLGLSAIIVKILLIDSSCKKALTMDVNAAKVYGISQYAARLLLTALALVTAILIDSVGFLGCVLAIFSLRIAAHIVPLIKDR